jgi:integrase
VRTSIADGKGRFYIVVDGAPSADGKRRRKWHGSWATRREAEHALPGIVGSIHDGSYIPADKVTVASFMKDEWLPAARSSLRASTHKLYETLVDAYVVPRIGDVRLQQLAPSTLNAMYANLLESGKRDGSPLGAESVAKVHRLMHRALRDAEKWDRISRNPAARADPPKAPRPDMHAWSASDVHRFLDHAADDRLASLWTLLATTGMRRAEALGVRWGDLDLDAGRLSVNQTLAYTGTVPTFSAPKTARSRRLVVVERETIAALRRHRARQAEERLAVGEKYADLDLVFAHVDGSPLNPATVSRIFNRLVIEATLPRITLHGLRHTFATVALSAGIPAKVVSECLGHSSTQITLDVYSHVDAGMQGNATSLVAGLIRNAR